MSEAVGTRNVILPNGHKLKNVPTDISPEQVAEEAVRRGLTTPEELEADLNWGKVLENAPGSFWDQMKGLAYAVTHPLQTAEAAYDLAEGGLGNAFDTTNIENRRKANAFGANLADKYSGWDRFKRSLEQDPFEVASDASSVMTPIGAGIKGGVKAAGKVMPRDPLANPANAGLADRLAGQAGGAANAAGEAIASVGTALEPANIAMNAASLPWRHFGASRAPIRMEKNAFNNTSEEFANLALRNGYAPSYAGFQRFKNDYVEKDKFLKNVVEANPELSARQKQIFELRDIRNRLKESEVPEGVIESVGGQKLVSDTNLLPMYDDRIMKLRQEMYEIDPRLQQLDDDIRVMQENFDAFGQAFGRSELIHGNFGSDVVLPAGTGYALGSTMTAIPGAAGVAAAGTVFANRLNMPVYKAHIANYVANAPNPAAGFLTHGVNPFVRGRDNRLLNTMLHQQVENVGNEENAELMEQNNLPR